MRDREKVWQALIDEISPRVSASPRREAHPGRLATDRWESQWRGENTSAMVIDLSDLESTPERIRTFKGKPLPPVDQLVTFSDCYVTERTPKASNRHASITGKIVEMVHPSD